MYSVVCIVYSYKNKETIENDEEYNYIIIKYTITAQRLIYKYNKWLCIFSRDREDYKASLGNTVGEKYLKVTCDSSSAYNSALDEAIISVAKNLEFARFYILKII